MGPQIQRAWGGQALEPLTTWIHSLVKKLIEPLALNSLPPSLFQGFRGEGACSLQATRLPLQPHRRVLREQAKSWDASFPSAQPAPAASTAGQEPRMSRLSKWSQRQQPHRVGLARSSSVSQSCPTLRPRGLWPTRFFCPWGFPEYWSGLPFPTPLAHSRYPLMFVESIN